jgi:DNA-binding NarL/FixJ family response regulator
LWLRALRPQERQVLALLAYGLALPEVAALTHRSLSIVSRQKASAMAKLSLADESRLIGFLRASLHSLDVAHAQREDVLSALRKCLK